MAALKAHQAESARRRAAAGPDFVDRGLVFCRDDGGPVDPDTVSRAMARLVKKAGLPAGLTFHGLRHSHASILLEGGAAGLRDVAARLGHTSTAFTVATYRHVLPGQDASLAPADLDEDGLAGNSGSGARGRCRASSPSYPGFSI